MVPERNMSARPYLKLRATQLHIQLYNESVGERDMPESLPWNVVMDRRLRRENVTEAHTRGM
eukprot:COSAG02_NODE_2772_length_8058_cov_64.441513_1_plen_62_part_00